MAMQQFDREQTIPHINVTESNTSTSLKQSAPLNHEIDKASSKIVLATINAKYIHASLGLRYLYANLKELQNNCEIKEFVIQTRPIDIVEKI